MFSRPIARAALASAIALALSGTTQAQITVIVTNANDDGSGSLRQAIIETNAAPGADIIGFGLSSAPATINLKSGELAITDDLTISGPGAAELTIDAGGGSRLVDVNGARSGSIDVNLSGLTLINGNADFGGAIRSQEANLTITDITISGNTAGREGGGLWNSTGTMTITDTTIDGNTAGREGGGLWNGTGTVTITGTTIDGNTANNSGTGSNGIVKGGGIYSGGTVTITSSAVIGNTANNSANAGLDLSDLSVFGGGIYQDGGSLTIDAAIITDNTAGATGAAEQGSVKGAGVYSEDAIVAITNTVVTGNTAGNEATVESSLSSLGGGIHQDRGTLTITDTTISGNTAGATGSAEHVLIKGGGIYSAGVAAPINGAANYSGTETIDATTISGATVIIDGSTISGNTVSNGAVFDLGLSCFGGGIHQDSGNLTVIDSTISGNTANSGSGLIEFSGFCHAGGFSLATSDPVTITNSTVSDNNAEGILRLSDDSIVGDLIIESSTIVGDIAGDHAVILHNAIVTGTLPNKDGPPFPGPGNGPVFATYSLIQTRPPAMVDDSEAPGTNLIGVNPMIGNLMPNGGPTETHALLAGSPAINSADPNDFPDADQRGVWRPQGRGADMGAFEVPVGGGALVAFFDQAVADGSLVGSGRGRSADGRRRALRNMLLATDQFIAQGDDDEACAQLLDAYDRTDGEFPPPDFVEGEAADDLADKIAATYTALDCD